MNAPVRGFPRPADARVRSNCFGCCQTNAQGLQLQFQADGGAGGVVAAVRFDDRFESYPGVVHGGLVATVLDEAMGRALTAATGALGLTVGLRVRYARPAEPGQAYEVRGAVAGRDGDVIKTLARLTEPSGGLVAAAEATFRLVDAAAARRGDAGLPGRTLAYIDDELAEQASP